MKTCITSAAAALATLLAAGPSFAQDEPQSFNAFATVEANGTIVRAAATRFAVVGTLDGRFYVETPEGPVDGDINAGLDILFGVGFDAGPIIPYSQLKVFVGDGSQLSLAFGLRF